MRDYRFLVVFFLVVFLDDFLAAFFAIGGVTSFLIDQMYVSEIFASMFFCDCARFFSCVHFRISRANFERERAARKIARLRFAKGFVCPQEILLH
jgi:hypothetical protein